MRFLALAVAAAALTASAAVFSQSELYPTLSALTGNEYLAIAYPPSAGPLYAKTSQITTMVAAAIKPPVAQVTPSNPTGTTSTTGVMMGLAVPITPALTGRVLIIISGSVTNDTSGDGASVQVYTGTGTAPANAAAITGTACGGLTQFNEGSAIGVIRVPFATNCIVSGLTLGTAVWIDLGLAAITGGTASMSGISVSAVEL